MRPVIAVLAAAVLTIGSMGAAHAAPASDETRDLPTDFKAPFECGLETTYATYSGHDQNALDFIRADGGQDTGTPILASAPGTAQVLEQDGAGLVVNIHHAGGWETKHYHLDSQTVTEGEEVEQGQQIGTLGNTGDNTTGAHLHYEQRLNEVAQEIEFEGESLGYPLGYHEEFVTSTNGCDGEEPPPEAEPTELAYTGPETATNGEPLELSGTLTDEGGDTVAEKAIEFVLGAGDGEQVCEGTTDGDGNASCTIDEVDQPLNDDGTVTVTLTFAGDDEYEASEASAELRITLETELEFTGPETVANDEPAELSGTLIDETGAAVADKDVEFVLGAGEAEQACEGTTDGDGNASCTIDEVDQPLNDDATVPVALTFAGSDFYLPSEASSDVALGYVTGSAFGLSAEVPVLGLPISLGPEPETGEVRTADAETMEPVCSERIGSTLITADVLCAEVETGTAPASSTASSNVADASIGLVGLPVIGVSGLEVSSTSTCEEQTGSVDMTLTVAGVPVEVGDTPDLEVDLGGILGTKLVVNEQIEEEDGGFTVNGVHLTGPGGIDVVVGSATSAAHNCP
ncbi:choice-of-anchor P family protein [Nocardiopsis sp. NPDC055551]|uniref:M23 family metallopeptidase n=1 Tax=Nocardiopsis sp. NPDC006832 TaxID=3157188 RepID=UPI0033CFB5BA